MALIATGGEQADALHQWRLLQLVNRSLGVFLTAVRKIDCYRFRHISLKVTKQVPWLTLRQQGRFGFRAYDYGRHCTG